MFTLLDACTQYIEYCNTLEGIKHANPKAYEIAFIYAYNGKTTRKEEEYLTEFFNL